MATKPSEVANRWAIEAMLRINNWRSAITADNYVEYMTPEAAMTIRDKAERLKTIIDTRLAALMPRLAEALVEEHDTVCELVDGRQTNYRLNLVSHDRESLITNFTAALERELKEIKE